MQVHDIGKLGLIALLVIGIFVLVVLDEIEFDQALPLLTAIGAYLMGNGVLAVRGRAPSPVIVPKIDAPDVATTHGTVPVDEVPGIIDAAVAVNLNQPPARRPGEHLTGEHFLRPDQQQALEDPYGPPEQRQRIAEALWPQPARPYDVIADIPVEDLIPSTGPATSFERYMIGREIAGRERTELVALCTCGHPALHHVESQTHPRTFLWCTNTAPTFGPSAVEARCACDMFKLDPDHPDNREFWTRLEEEHHGHTPT